MWVEFVVCSLLCSERFFSGYSGFPLSSKTNISKFQFDQESGKRRTTLWMRYLQLVIYLFIYFINFRSYALEKTPYIILNCAGISPLQVRSLKVTLFVVTWGVDGQELKFCFVPFSRGIFLVRCRCLAKWCYTGQITLNLRTKKCKLTTFIYIHS